MSQEVGNSQDILLAMFLSIFLYIWFIEFSYSSVALAGARFLVRHSYLLKNGFMVYQKLQFFWKLMIHGIL